MKALGYASYFTKTYISLAIQFIEINASKASKCSIDTRHRCHLQMGPRSSLRNFWESSSSCRRLSHGLHTLASPVTIGQSEMTESPCHLYHSTSRPHLPRRSTADVESNFSCSPAFTRHNYSSYESLGT